MTLKSVIAWSFIILAGAGLIWLGNDIESEKAESEKLNIILSE